MFMDLITVAIGGTAVTLTLMWWWVSTRRPSGVPPGPGPALPLVGHFHLLTPDPRPQFRAWRRQYGDVFSLYMGSRLMVVLNGHHVLREALVKQADLFSDRPDASIFKLITKSSKGVGDTSGPLWKAQRKVTVEILRQLGMGRNLLATRVQEEVASFITHIHAKDAAPFDPTHLIQVSVSNNICSIVLGRRFQYDDDHFLSLQAALEEMLVIGGRASYLDFVPLLKHLPGDPFQIQRLHKLYDYIMDTFLIPIIQEHVHRYDREGEGGEEKKQNGEGGEEKEQKEGEGGEVQPEEEMGGDFISAYIRESRLAPDRGTAEYINDFNLQKLLMDLFAGGSDTTNNAIRWTLIYFLHYPEVQEKCHQDILRVIGTSLRRPHLADRANMTYIEATINEVLRIAEVVPFALAHAPAREVQFRGYTIPKDAYIVPNLDSVLRDPEVWDQPEVFRPERFLGEDGKLNRVDEFLPFSLGRRRCLGESLARTELFLYLTSMIQHFRFLPPEDGQLPSLQGEVGLVHNPKPFIVRAVARQ